MMSDMMISEAGVAPAEDGEFGRGYILRQMEKILEQKDYLHEAIESLSKMHDGDSGDCSAPGNLLGQAKANALRDIVCHREATNQQMLKLYERMYYDLQGSRGSAS